MIDYDREIEGMNGEPARVLCRDLKRTDGFTVLVAMVSERNVESLYVLDANGEDCGGGFRFRNKPREVVGYVNVYQNGLISEIHESRRKADELQSKSRSRIACIRVAFKEGQLDD